MANDIGIKGICMLNTHGYFDPVPQLGKTDTGGQVVYVLELSKALSRLGIKVDIVNRWFDQSKPQIDPVPDYPDVRVVRIPSSSWEFVAKEEIYALLPELSQNLITFIKQQGRNYDLYHGHYVDGGIVTLDVAQAFGKPAYFTAHSLGEWKRVQMGGNPEEMEKKFKFKHRKSEELRVFNSVKAHAVTSLVQEEKLKELYDWTGPNLDTLPPGVDVHTYKPMEPGEEHLKTTLQTPSNYIFCLSRIDTNKGHDLLINAFALLADEHPEVQLAIGGGSPKPQERERNLLAKINAMIADKGLQDRIHMLGYVPDEDMPLLYKRARMFVLPSLFEPFGMTTLEAMSCGTPVIASKLGGIRTVITSGQNGLLVDPSNSQEFADAMHSMLSDIQLANRLGDAGHVTIQQQYSWEAIAQKHLDFYQNFK